MREKMNSCFGISRELVGAILLTAIMFSCGCNTPKKKSKKNDSGKTMRVVAVSYPLQYLAQRIAGDKVTVEFPVPEGEDPREWSPSVSQIQELQSADLVIANGPGAEYAKWLVRVSLLDSKLIGAANDLAIADYFLVNDYQIVHTHGGEGEHSHPYTVPYSWLEPAVAKKQADSIAASLTKTYPELKEEIDSNLKQLQSDLDKLSEEFSAAGLEGTVVVSTPDAKFLTRALGLEDKHLLLFDFETSSRNDAIARLTKLGDQKIDKFIWVDTAAYQGSEEEKAEMLEQLFPKDRPEVIQVELMDHAPKNGDYLSAMRELLQKFQ